MIVEGFLTSLSAVKSSVVSQDALESALDTLLNVSSDNDYQCIQVFNAFDQPKLIFHPSTKTYEVSADPTRKLHASSAHRLSLFRERYARTQPHHHSIVVPCRFSALERRVLRHKSFSKPVAATSSSSRVESFQEVRTTSDPLPLSLTHTEQISRIESLLGVTGMKRVLGMLGQDERQQVYLEDMTSRIYLDISEAELDCFVVLSDVHLDEPAVMARLDALFSGYEPFTPTLFILMGNFTSSPVGYGYGTPTSSKTIRTLKQHFDDLATLLLKYPALVEKSQFLFVPGPDDPGAPHVLPRHPLILADKCKQFQVNYAGVSVFHPGPFHVDYSFVLYRPASNTAEVSRVDID
ncbi:hypothetical protein DYB30_006111 [Aphanomyces astaci]|uniref:DNA polymerase II subunit 2 n=2 Tax=Aphanomyces astaci TaxID=112090 RepID=A0A397D331_APHAT|nr:hypothetical protein DYB30_006111 [Aphanomyces astaci]RHY72133.1 hypothetical protein DYB38_002930 [Aphanomyces astaci]